MNDKLKTTLKVILLAGDQTVAESADPVLWQKVLKSITGQSEIGTDIKSYDRKNDVVSVVDVQDEQGDGALQKFAEFLKVDTSQLQGVCDPVVQEPYLHLDHTAWANWRKLVPAKGRASISAFAMTGTLLALWFMQLRKGNVAYAQVAAVLEEINVDVMNPTRSVKNCSWLQPKGRAELRLHPSYIGDAIAAARTFIAGKALKD